MNTNGIEIQRRLKDLKEALMNIADWVADNTNPECSGELEAEFGNFMESYLKDELDEVADLVYQQRTT